MDDIRWFGHASFAIIDSLNGNRIYFIDPYELLSTTSDKADLIFITHAHHDHLSLGDINHILKPATIVIATVDSLATLKIPSEQKFEVTPNKSYDIKGTKFETVPAYNIREDRLNYHPKSNNWVGYILYVNNQKIYHAGDTDFIPEMRDLSSKNLDIAMLPMGGTYTMEVEEMTEAANAIAAKITIPMHYRRLLGDKHKEAEQKLKQGVTNSKVVILEELS
jgi:L-ascorbate metabolism protein UlaG (beta-lactamase superfamily)